MSAIASFLLLIFQRVASYLVLKTSLELTIKLAVATAFLAALATFVAAVAAVQGKLYAAVPSWVQWGLDLLPSNTVVCIGCIAATYAAAWTYEIIVTMITIKGRV